jgi:putative membrane protein
MKLHPVSIPYRVASRAASAAFALFFVGSSLVGAGVVDAPALPVALGGAGSVLAVAWELAYYRRFEYELTPDTLDVRSGVLARRDREIPLRRVQNVDISRNVVQRLLGVAAVTFETAGGGDTEAALRYVSASEAKRLQRELARLKAEAADDDRTGDETIEETLFELDDSDLLVLSAVSVDARVASAFSVLVPFAVSRTPDTLIEGAALVLAVVGAAATLLLAWVTSAAATFVRFYGFRLSRVGDDLRYERGLLQRYDGSIPLDKVQTVTLRENAAMRRLGYAALAAETAGYAPGSSPSGGSEAAIPLARRGYVLDLAARLGGDADPDFERPPTRARRRYAGRYLIALGVLTGALFAVDAVGVPLRWWWLPVALAPLAPVAAHFKWRSRGYHLGDDHVVTRNGFWRRETRVVPYYRVQTVIQHETVFQRRWRLATVVADTAGTLGFLGRDAAAVDVDRGTAERLRDAVHERMQAARRKRQATGRGGTVDTDDVD